MANTALITGSTGGLGSCFVEIHAEKGGDLILVGRALIYGVYAACVVLPFVVPWVVKPRYKRLIGPLELTLCYYRVGVKFSVKLLY